MMKSGDVHHIVKHVFMTRK